MMGSSQLERVLKAGRGYVRSRAKVRASNWARLGDQARNRRDWIEAISCYASAIAIKPDSPGIIVQLGHALKEIGGFDAARVRYLTAREQTPRDDDLHLQLGHLEKVAGHIEAAVMWYRRAAALNPGNTDARSELEFLGAAVSDGDQPPPDAKQPPRKRPGLFGARRPRVNWTALGDHARDRGDWIEAFASYSAAVAVRPRAAGIIVQLGHALKEIGEFDAARTRYLAALALMPQDGDLHLQLGHLEKVAGNPDAAVTWYRRAVSLSADNADARRELYRLGADVTVPPRSPIDRSPLGYVERCCELLALSKDRVSPQQRLDLAASIERGEAKLAVLDALREQKLPRSADRFSRRDHAKPAAPAAASGRVDPSQGGDRTGQGVVLYVLGAGGLREAGLTSEIIRKNGNRRNIREALIFSQKDNTPQSGIWAARIEEKMNNQTIQDLIIPANVMEQSSNDRMA